VLTSRPVKCSLRAPHFPLPDARSALLPSRISLNTAIYLHTRISTRLALHLQQQPAPLLRQSHLTHLLSLPSAVPSIPTETARVVHFARLIYAAEPCSSWTCGPRRPRRQSGPDLVATRCAGVSSGYWRSEPVRNSPPGTQIMSASGGSPGGAFSPVTRRSSPVIVAADPPRLEVCVELARCLTGRFHIRVVTLGMIYGVWRTGGGSDVGLPADFSRPEDAGRATPRSAFTRSPSSP
jgi:hypothetical protein